MHLSTLFCPALHVGMQRALITSDTPGELINSAARHTKENMQEKMKVLSTIVERTGIASVFRRTIAGRSGLILALHRVLPVEEQAFCYNPHLVLNESAFVSLLQLLQRDYNVVPLEDLLSDPGGEEGHPKVAITFDDGWEDNYRVAFPHLLRFGMPATIFACTGLIDTLQLLPEERFARLWSQCSAHSTLEELVVDLNHWGMGKSKNPPAAAAPAILVIGTETDAVERPPPAARSPGTALSNDHSPVTTFSHLGTNLHHDPHRLDSNWVAHSPPCHAFLGKRSRHPPGTGRCPDFPVEARRRGCRCSGLSQRHV